MHVDLSFSYLRSAATASFDKKSSTGTAQVDWYQQCWMTYLLMLVIQFAPRRGIYFSLKITVTFIYGIFKKVDMVASLSIFLFF
jgi:hypothetical protein